MLECGGESTVLIADDKIARRRSLACALWKRSAFASVCGAATLLASASRRSRRAPHRGRPPVKAEAALRVATPLLEAPVANRHKWTLARLIGEARGRHHVQIASVQGAA